MDTQIVHSKAEGGQGKTFCRSLGGDGRYCRWGLWALVGSEAKETNIVLIFWGGNRNSVSNSFFNYPDERVDHILKIKKNIIFFQIEIFTEARRRPECLKSFFLTFVIKIKLSSQNQVLIHGTLSVWFQLFYLQPKKSDVNKVKVITLAEGNFFYSYL